MYVRWPKQVECLRVESVRVCLCLGSHHEVVRNANIVVEIGLAAIPGMLSLEDMERIPDWLSACVMNASLLFVRIMVLRVVISIASRRDRSRGQTSRIDPRDNEKAPPANTRNILLCSALLAPQTQIWIAFRLAQKWSARADTEPCVQQDPQYCWLRLSVP